MKNFILKFCALYLFISSNYLLAENGTDDFIPTPNTSASSFTSVRAMINLSAITNPVDGDIVLVEGYRTAYDGGGGMFVYDTTSFVEPIYQDTGVFLMGFPNSGSNAIFNGFYDGMVVKPRSLTDGFPPGRWIRQWDRGKLNIRWFGGSPGNSSDCSRALNTALNYSQRPLDNSDIFSNKSYTSPGKTIYFPSGKYFFKSAITDINYGVVIAGEGNMGVSDHGTHFWMQLNYVETAPDIPSANQSGYFRFLSNQSHSSGGGFKNLLISIEADSSAGDFIHQNVITLRAVDNKVVVGGSAPALSKWTAENVVINCRGNALRAIYMRSYVTEGALPYRIRDVSLINCWFAGNTQYAESVHAQNVSGLHVIGGFFSSGRGNNVDPSMPGIFLGGTHGCYNTHLDGVDLTHATILIHEYSAFVNIDCRFGRLEILYREDINTDSTSIANLGHYALQVTKQSTLNLRRYPNSPIDNTPNRLKCPEPGDLGYDTKYTPDDFYWKCYNNPHEIEIDPDWD